MPFQAKVILDSIGPQENRLTTMEFTIPKLWLAEFNTHCMFARNSASTRAIPFSKQVELMEKDTFTPFEWPLEAPGMAHKQEVTDPKEVRHLLDVWKSAQMSSVIHAKQLAGVGIHKQLAGRLLEPWRFQTVLVTGDEASYANFFHLRRDRAAAPEIHRTADLMWEAYKKSSPEKLNMGEWHVPLIRRNEPLTYSPDERQGPMLADLREISSARCARLSYLTHHGIRDIGEDVKLFNKLTSSGHWSPLEHVCMALPKLSWWREKALSLLKAAPVGHGKWTGWHQYRKDFPNEYWKEIGK